MKDKEPFVVHGLQFFFPLGKLGHLQIKECQLIVKDMLVINIHKFHFMPKAVLRILIIRKDKIEDSDRVDSFEVKVPNSLLPLVLNSKRRIKDSPILEKLLLGFLHLNNKGFAFFILAVDIKDGTAVAIAIAKFLAIEISEVMDDLPPFK